ncbi:MAG: rRNA maturation RNase YbeY [Christensenellales bacterium]|jgi:homotetrameric cytidine deaminase/rRNA maturation RNase YbeY
MLLEIDNRQNVVTLDEEIKQRVHEALEATLEAEGKPENVAISLIFVDDEQMQRLNGEFRGVESATDVLSFPMLDNFDFEMAQPDEETGFIYLGDIAISLQRARVQALDFGHSLLREVAYLAVHAMLHLLGYDHMEPQEKTVMRSREKTIMSKMGIYRFEGDARGSVDDLRLISTARVVRENAYAPYSGFRVGAAILTADGSQIFTGCNVENASYGATCCAERVAIYSAVASGVKAFKQIAVVGEGNAATWPCGVCRQVLYEFAPDIDVITDDGDRLIKKNLRELLPDAFGPERLDEENR